MLADIYVTNTTLIGESSTLSRRAAYHVTFDDLIPLLRIKSIVTSISHYRIFIKGTIASVEYSVCSGHIT